MWGKFNEDGLPITWVTTALTRKQGQYVVRSLRRHRQSKVVWLHSMSSHDSTRSQGKITEWKRLRVQPGGTFNGEEIRSLEWLMSEYRSLGFRIKRVRPRVFRQETINVWSEDEGTGKLEKRGGADGSETEIYAAAPAWYYVSGECLGKLISAAKRLHPEGES